LIHQLILAFFGWSTSGIVIKRILPRFLLAIYAPSAVLPVTGSVSLAETVRVSLDSLNAANEAGEFGKILAANHVLFTRHFNCFRNRLATFPKPIQTAWAQLTPTRFGPGIVAN